MKHRSLFFYLPGVLLAILAAFLGLFWHLSSRIESVCIKQAKVDLEVRTKLLLPYCRALLGKEDSEQIARLNRNPNFAPETRVTIMRLDGSVIGDTQEAAEHMDNHISRPEIAPAAAANAEPGIFYESDRYSTTLNRRMFYCSTLLDVNGKSYIIRTAIDTAQIDRVIREARANLLTALGFAILAATVLAILITSRFTFPAQQLLRAVRRVAAGELETPLPVPQHGSIRELAVSIREMTDQLKSRLEQVTREKSERDAIFSALFEGIVLLDNHHRIIDVNRTAQRLLELEETTVRNSDILGLVRNKEFESFILKTTSTLKPMEIELDLENATFDRQLRLRANPIVWGDGESDFGILLVIYDLTRMRKLESYRRDFVANVSHEIKTPLTVIAGAVETLQDGALDDPQAAQRFMQIIVLHAKRLSSLVEDILSLSDLECRSPEDQADMQDAAASDIAATAAELCQARAEIRGSKIVLEDHTYGALIRADRTLVEQALVNLIDNAVKYSNAGDTIEVSFDCTVTQVRWTVRDHGPGIAPEHLPRLFERFYRVDKARSRDSGGTGLGLAIVKHIAQLHGGKIEVESQPGSGSVFTLTLPRIGN